MLSDLTEVPAGTVRLRIFHTGFTPQLESVTIAAGQRLERDITLGASRPETLKPDEKVVKLDQFLVGETREMEAAAIAINDQRRNLVTGASIEPGTYVFTPARNTIDVLGEYTFWKRFAVFANLRNIGDVPNEDAAEGPSTPGHAKLRQRERYGSLWTFGIKGTF